jgi:hypothetical protein
MTTVRGKAPLRLTFNPKCAVNAYRQTITIETGFWSGPNQITARGELSVYCATNLIRELRKGLRQIRDENQLQLEHAIAQAEGPL